MELFWNYVEVVGAQHCECTKCHWIVRLKIVNFTLCKFHLNVLLKNIILSCKTEVKVIVFPEVCLSYHSVQLKTEWIVKSLYIGPRISDFREIGMTFSCAIKDCHLGTWYLFEVCPEGIQPCNMKNRDIYWRRYKIQKTLYRGQWCLSPLQSRHLGTLHSSLNFH